MKKEAWNEGWLVRHLNTNDAWQQITLPYDCMIHEQRSDDAEGGCNNGWFMGYDYELMKRFRCSDMQLKRRIRTYLELEAVYRQGEVYCNDQLVVKRDNGYLNLTGELTPYLREGENTVRVIAHNVQMPSARWYTGAGIYRPAWWYEVPKNTFCCTACVSRQLAFPRRRCRCPVKPAKQARSRWKFSTVRKA